MTDARTLDRLLAHLRARVAKHNGSARLSAQGRIG